MAGDMDGDGVTDLGVWRPSTRMVFVPGASYRMGRAGDEPLLADMTGRGRVSPDVHRPVTSSFGFGRSYLFGHVGRLDRGCTFTP